MFSFEVKFCEELNLTSWWLQCLNQAAKQKDHKDRPATPVLFYKASRTAWSVKMRAYVQTPHEHDQVELDVTMSMEDFLPWFENALDEAFAVA